MPRRPKAGRIALAAAILAVAALLLHSAAVRHGVAAMLVLADLQAGDAPTLLKRLAPPPARHTVQYEAAGKLHTADIYLPLGEVRAGIVLVPGAHPAGKDDPRLVHLAQSLARVHFAVLVPDIPGLRQLKVHASDVSDVAAAINYLEQQPRLAPDGRLGMGAFSYAVGPALLAALRLQGKVRFIFAMGGYYNLEQVITFFTTGYFRLDGQWQHLPPNRYGMWVFAKSILELLASAEDRRLFTEMAERKLADVHTPIANLAHRLGPEGRRLYALLSNTDPRRVPELIAALPASIRQRMDELNLAKRNLSRLAARCILIHSRGDNIIPYSESIDLARALPVARTRLYLIGEATHVDVRQLSWRDWFRLWQALNLLLAEQEEGRHEDDPG